MKPSWFGESIGHYENGNTLVVDTIGLSTMNSFIDNYRTPHSEIEHVVERYKLTNDGQMLEASVTVDDSLAFNEPLHVVKRWRKVKNEVLETVCAENNGDRFEHNLFPIPRAIDRISDWERHGTFVRYARDRLAANPQQTRWANTGLIRPLPTAVRIAILPDRGGSDSRDFGMSVRYSSGADRW